VEHGFSGSGPSRRCVGRRSGRDRYLIVLAEVDKADDQALEFEAFLGEA